MATAEELINGARDRMAASTIERSLGCRLTLSHVLSPAPGVRAVSMGIPSEARRSPTGPPRLAPE